jgi:hypothetical protein
MKTLRIFFAVLLLAAGAQGQTNFWHNSINWDGTNAHFIGDGSLLFNLTVGSISNLNSTQFATNGSPPIISIKDHVTLTNIDNGGSVKINLGLLELFDTVPSASVDWGNRLLLTTANQTSVDYQNGILNETIGGSPNKSVDWTSHFLYDGPGTTITEEWANRKLDGNWTNTGTFGALLFAGNGANLTNLNATELRSGIVSTVVGGNGATASNARGVGANVGVAQASAVGGNNAIIDMDNYSSAFEGQLAVTYSGNKWPYLWFYDGGAGSNHTGYPLNIGGGLANIGDLKNMPINSMSNSSTKWFWMGNSNYWGSNNVFNPVSHAGSDVSLYLEFVNPYGSGSLNISTFSTNPTGNTLVGKAVDGNNIYLENEFGMQLVNVFDGDPVGVTNAAGDMGLIANMVHGRHGFFISDNFAISGESGNGGQRSYFNIDSRGQTNALLNAVGFPFWVANVWQPTQNGWVWGAWDNPTYGDWNVLGTNWLQGSAVINWNHPGADFINSQFAVNFTNDSSHTANMGASFNAVNNYGAVTFDGSQTHRLGFVMKNGVFTMLTAGSGAPLNLGHSSVSDLLGTAIGSQTLTVQAGLDSSGNFFATNNLGVGGTANVTGLLTLNNGVATVKTNQFAVASSGWTNTNAFDCVMYITAATAATFTYSDGTNTIFTDTGLTFTTSESLVMHPSYKVVVASGTITGVAIVK